MVIVLPRKAVGPQARAHSAHPFTDNSKVPSVFPPHSPPLRCQAGMNPLSQPPHSGQQARSHDLTLLSGVELGTDSVSLAVPLARVALFQELCSICRMASC